eukprot:CAMPEP_0206459634 /NCGR_PEP_ID=MMETSP0324_2-20121206/24290_1 /ASSEMBLY_ACC=CAM_ASM_000836 /TAXON_ID=2866 /ORGANISM="Crypthecodinium cohnii, Strain Seligo" /LENGTH=260 /DNA_ID=CAMNT_0053931217 /DNA_START=68 /DNA_END=850 /DNA_ORIENTATION=-
MGCNVSKAPPAPVSAVPPAAEAAKPAAAPAAAEPGAKPVPQIFAIMRNGHEVIRGAMRDCTALLDKDDMEGYLKRYAEFMKWMNVHAEMEDGKEGIAPGFFFLLNEKFDNIAKPLQDAHGKLHEVETKLESAHEKKDLAEIKAAWKEFAEFNEQHLLEEEKIMMPKIGALKEAGENMRELFNKFLFPLATQSPDVAFFMTFAMQVLEVHHENQPRCRVFAHAVQFASTPEEWAKFHPLIKEGLSPDLYQKISTECGWSKE